jgi:hypothetical protein
MSSLTAVREPLAATGKPYVNPAAALAAAIASSSCDPRTLWLCLPANDRAVRISSAKQTGKMRNGHGWMFFFGIFFPILWIFGAFMRPAVEVI